MDAPTPNELLNILRIADRYARNSPQDREVVDKVDSWKSGGGDRSPGVRRYLQSEAQVKEYVKLRDNMRALFRGMTPEQLNRPLEQPPREVGYAADGASRLKQASLIDSS